MYVWLTQSEADAQRTCSKFKPGQNSPGAFEVRMAGLPQKGSSWKGPGGLPGAGRALFLSLGAGLHRQRPRWEFTELYSCDCVLFCMCVIFQEKGFWKKPAPQTSSSLWIRCLVGACYFSQLPVASMACFLTSSRGRAQDR